MRPSNKDLFELDEARMQLATKIHPCFASKDAVFMREAGFSLRFVPSALFL
jgi:hypothetical protein